MKILAFDTAMQSCSVALTEDSRLLAEVNLVNTETHSRHLAGLIRDVCRMARTELSEIDGYAVTRGPGSFTGLRIGISTAIGLAQASGKPIAGVSTLHSLAAQATVPSQLVCPMIDARRGEVYVSVLRYATSPIDRKATRAGHEVPRRRSRPSANLVYSSVVVQRLYHAEIMEPLG